MTALYGIRILDLTIWQQGPMTTAMLADWGADVIKIEGPDSPDPGRSLVRYEITPGGPNAYFETHNRNKRGIVLDLKSEAGRDVFYRLVKDADVVIQNFRPGVGERLGIDYETLRAINPRSRLLPGVRLRPARPGRRPARARSARPGPWRPDERHRRARRPADAHVRRHGGPGERLPAGLRHHGRAVPSRAHRRGPDGRRLAAAGPDRRAGVQHHELPDVRHLRRLADPAHLAQDDQPAVEPLPRRRRQVDHARDGPDRPLLADLREAHARSHRRAPRPRRDERRLAPRERDRAPRADHRGSTRPSRRSPPSTGSSCSAVTTSWSRSSRTTANWRRTRR